MSSVIFVLLVLGLVVDSIVLRSGGRFFLVIMGGSGGLVGKASTPRAGPSLEGVPTLNTIYIRKIRIY